jgi:hypothetical protein
VAGGGTNGSGGGTVRVSGINLGGIGSTETGMGVRVVAGGVGVEILGAGIVLGVGGVVGLGPKRFAAAEGPKILPAAEAGKEGGGVFSCIRDAARFFSVTGGVGVVVAGGGKGVEAADRACLRFSREC